MRATSPWTRSPWTDAGQLAELVDPDDVAAGAHGIPPHDWFARLVEQGRLTDAVMFLAQALPRYECVVWGTQALLRMGAVSRSDPAAVAALRWIDSPSDDLRRAAGELADSAKLPDAAEMLLNAVALSGGSLAPEDLPSIQPPPDVCGRLVSGSILTGAHEQSDPTASLRQALELGAAIAAGG